MGEIRVGDFVRARNGSMAATRVTAVREKHAWTNGPVWSFNELEHCAPDPLPAKLPAGTRFPGYAGRGPLKHEFRNDSGAQTTDCGRVSWYGVSLDSIAVQVFPEEVDWASYHEALHRSGTNPFTGPPATDTTPAKCDHCSVGKSTHDSLHADWCSHRRQHEMGLSDPPAPFVPRVGERVRLDWIASGGAPVGSLIDVRAAVLSPCGTYIHLTGDSAPDQPSHGYSTAWCRVSPLRSALDVECPYVSLSAAQAAGGFRACKGVCGKECSETEGCGTIDHLPDGRQYHRARRQHFLALTGNKDSTGSAHESDAGTARDSAPAHRGESGTGRAAGKTASEGAYLTPAAPSGFKPLICPGLVEVGGRKCGAEIMRGVTMCGDCLASLDSAHNQRRARGVGILRTDLDRPLPKAQAAERIWPRAWSSASSESDP